MFLALSAWATWPTFDSSAAVIGCPSARLTTMIAVDVVCCGNAFLPSSIACTDSYDRGRKLPWSAEVISANDGAVTITPAASTSQPAMTHHALRTTNRPSQPNMLRPHFAAP